MSDEDITILVLDDEPLVLRALQLQLERFGFDVSTSDHPEQAMATLESTAFDVLICDNNMPMMSGTMFLQSIRDRFPLMKRFMLTGSTPVDQNGSVELKGLCVEKVFRKPCHVAEIAESIRTAMDQPG